MMELAQFGWRDFVLVVAVLIGIYLAVMLLRLMHLGRNRKRALEIHATPPRLDLELGTAADPAPAAADPTPTSASVRSLFSRPAENDAAPPASFGGQLQLAQLETEVAQLRGEVAALREELQMMRTANRVSPQYADAMALAQHGYDARGIADQCGITLGEAELVLAMARDTPDYEAEENHVGDAQRSAAYGAER